jgi:hypothetical protein
MDVCPNCAVGARHIYSTGSTLANLETGGLDANGNPEPASHRQSCTHKTRPCGTGDFGGTTHRGCRTRQPPERPHKESTMTRTRISSRIRRAAALGTLAVAASAVGLAAAPTAQAAGGNWAAWAGSTSTGCFGYTLWNANQATGYVNSHGNTCWIGVEQYDSHTHTTTGLIWYGPTTGATNTGAYWHGPASDGGVLSDEFEVYDASTGTYGAASPNYN